MRVSAQPAEAELLEASDVNALCVAFLAEVGFTAANQIAACFHCFTLDLGFISCAN